MYKKQQRMTSARKIILPSGKLNTYCAFAFQVKLISCETWQQVAFPDSWIADQHNCNEN